MDQNIHHNPFQNAPEDRESDDGANYLRNLKGDSKLASAPAVASSETGPPPVESASESSALNERRKTPRLRCSGSVEFRVEGAKRIWGTLTDIGIDGCYVEMNNTLPVGTKVELVLKSMGIRIETAGAIRATYPSLGMGLSFSGIQSDQLAFLNQLLSSLAGRTPFSP